MKFSRLQLWSLLLSFSWKGLFDQIHHPRIEEFATKNHKQNANKKKCWIRDTILWKEKEMLSSQDQKSKIIKEGNISWKFGTKFVLQFCLKQLLSCKLSTFRWCFWFSDLDLFLLALDGLLPVNCLSSQRQLLLKSPQRVFSVHIISLSSNPQTHSKELSSRGNISRPFFVTSSLLPPPCMAVTTAPDGLRPLLHHLS